MSAQIKMFPLKFEEAFQYVKDQLQDGNTLAKELLKNTDFKKGCFFALLHSSADKTKIYEFHSGGNCQKILWNQYHFRGKSILAEKNHIQFMN